MGTRAPKKRRPATPSRHASAMRRKSQREYYEHLAEELDDDMAHCSCRCSHLYEAECVELCSPYGS